MLGVIRLTCFISTCMTLSAWCTCVVLCQILVFVLLLLLAKPGTAGLLLLLRLLHGYTRHSPTTNTHTHCHFPKILSFCYSHSASACVFPSHHSCSSGEGMRPAVPFFVFSSLPCHQLWSSLEMIWMMSPTRKRMPASLQGISSSLEGSYSN